MEATIAILTMGCWIIGIVATTLTKVRELSKITYANSVNRFLAVLDHIPITHPSINNLPAGQIELKYT